MSNPHPTPLVRRPRRLRRSKPVRNLIQENRLHIHDLIAPLFVQEDSAQPGEVESMPGIFRFPASKIAAECAELQALGIQAVAVFPCIDPSLKDTAGSKALNPDNLALRTIRAIKQCSPDLIVITDVALDPYTSHGHDGVLNDAGDVDNDRTVAILAQMAVLQAAAGSDWVAPSDMMDGRIRAIRAALDAAGHHQTSILSYAAKFASAFYGPFRDAIGSRKAAGAAYLDKRTYQLNPANRREAILDALLDIDEGADLLMVKPAGPYLDILRDLRERTDLPLVAYQVSGEYSQLHAAARLGWLDLTAARDESLIAFKRAGADLVITYFAKVIAQSLASH